MVICLERGGNDLRLVQLMPLPPLHLLLHEHPEWFNPSGAGLPRLSWSGNEAVKRVSCLSVWCYVRFSLFSAKLSD